LETDDFAGMTLGREEWSGRRPRLFSKCRRDRLGTTVVPGHGGGGRQTEWRQPGPGLARGVWKDRWEERQERTHWVGPVI